MTREGTRQESIRVDVRFFPDYYTEGPERGRADIGAGHKLGTLNNSLDLARAVRKFAEQPGVYSATSYIGREKQDGEVFHVEMKGQSLVIGGEPVQPASGATPAQTSPVAPVQPVPAEGSSASSINATTETIRATKELLREVAPPAPPAPALTLADVERAASRAAEEAAGKVAEQFRQSRPEAPAPKSPADNINDIVSIVAAVDKLRGEKQTAPPAPAPNPFENYRTVKEQMRELAEEFTPPEGERGLVSQVLGLFETGLKTVDRTLSSPTGQRLAGALLSRYMGGQGAQMQPPTSSPQPGAEGPPQGQQAQAQPEQPQLPPGVVSAARALAREVTRDDVEKGADIVLSLINSEPMLAVELQQLFAAPSVTLVEWLSGAAGAPWLADLPHGVSYFDSLREELRERAEGEQSDEDAAAPEVSATSNGHKPAAAASVQ